MYKAGDVVCVSYYNFDNKPAVGIFLILYSERFDRLYTNGHTNITCAKITTNNLLGDSYTVRLRKGVANLETDCLVNISKQHTFTKEQAYKKLGTLDDNTMFNVFKELREYNEEVENQILQGIY